MNKITVKQLATMARVSSRTLRHYDDLGLLPAQRDSVNNYRYYTTTDMLRLQQILFYRKLGLSLSEIQGILHAPDFTLEKALSRHRSKRAGPLADANSNGGSHTQLPERKIHHEHATFV